MNKKLLPLACLSFLSLAVFAKPISCSAYLQATPYASAVDPIHHETFLVKRHFAHGVSNELYIFPNKEVIPGQSRVIPGKNACASFAKHLGSYVKYATYTIKKDAKGYMVLVNYKNGEKQTLQVKPLSKNAFRRLR